MRTLTILLFLLSSCSIADPEYRVYDVEVTFTYEIEAESAEEAQQIISELIHREEIGAGSVAAGIHLPIEAR